MSKKYLYLGIPFVSSGLFFETAWDFSSKANTSWEMLNKSWLKPKLESCEVRIKLLRNDVKPTLLHAAKIWNLRYINMLQTAQLRLLQNLCNWKTAPNYLFSVERSGYRYLELQIFINAIKWWQKLLQMSDIRYPKLCYKKLYSRNDN